MDQALLPVLPQVPKQARERLTPVAHGHFFFHRNLSERPAVRRVVEQRIVAESLRAARLLENRSFDDTAKRATQLSAVNQRDHANETRAPVVAAPQIPQPAPRVPR